MNKLQHGRFIYVLVTGWLSLLLETIYPFFLVSATTF
jgi:hypothetical protein